MELRLVIIMVFIINTKLICENKCMIMIIRTVTRYEMVAIYGHEISGFLRYEMVAVHGDEISGF